jgi:hypothetical protein
LLEDRIFRIPINLLLICSHYFSPMSQKSTSFFCTSQLG